MKTLGNSSGVIRARPGLDLGEGLQVTGLRAVEGDIFLKGSFRNFSEEDVLLTLVQPLNFELYNPWVRLVVEKEKWRALGGLDQHCCLGEVAFWLFLVL